MDLTKFLSYTRHALLVVTMVTFACITGCDDDDDDNSPSKNIWQLVEENNNLTMLKAQLSAADLDATLSGSGSYTLFAPSDAAMATLLSTLGLDNFESISPAVVKTVLEYHIANSQYLSASLTNGTEITTEQGETIKVITTTTGEKTLDTGATSDAKVTSADIRATNGVIHVVDVVLVPPSVGALIIETLGTVAQPILLGADFTILAEGLQKANEFATGQSLPTLTDILIKKNTDTLFTVFAPTNETFNTGGITAATYTGQQWYGIISHHIVAADSTYSTTDDFMQGQQLTTLATATTGKKLTVLATDAATNTQVTTGIVLDSNGDNTPNAQIAVLDVLAATGANPAANGVINVIAGVLSPQ